MTRPAWQPMPRPGTEPFEGIARQLSDDPSDPAHLLRRVVDWLDVDLVLDVGAHHGEFVRNIRDGAGYDGLAVSFEPDPDSFRVLQDAIDSDSRWTAVNVAVSDRAGVGTLRRFDRSAFNSLHAPLPALEQNFEIRGTGSIDVELVTLSSWIAEAGGESRSIHDSKSILLKSDTQGHDLNVIHGAGDLLDRVEAIVVEASVQALYGTTPSYLTTLGHLHDLGFVPAGFFGVTRDPGLLKLIDIDIVLVR